jgi:osmotically-inducible protein OsmY
MFFSKGLKEKRYREISRLWIIVIHGLLALLFLALEVDAAQIKDRDITLAVENQLINDDAVPFDSIDVHTHEGIVTLSGSVDNLVAKERSVKLAETIKGVRAVVNLIEVDPVSRTDEQIVKEVKSALFDYPATDRLGIKVTVTRGMVTLAGEVNSWQEKQLCSLVAKGVRGVKEIKNLIEVKYDTEISDREIETEISGRLEWDAWVDASLVDVKVEKGKVTLSGTVGSAAEKDRAYVDAWVMGTKSVDVTALEVDHSKYEKMERQKKYLPKKDEEIRVAIKRAFFYDPRLGSKEPEIIVDQGVVTLTGVVDDLAASRAAEEDARNTVGVWRVKNHLKVRPSVGPFGMPMVDHDAEIARTVRIALLRDPYVQQQEITVSVVNGIAILNGRVNGNFEKSRAEDIASRVEGVSLVRNNLDVGRSWTEKEDWEIKADVESELWWSPFVDSNEIIVSVNDGVVTLVGVVENLRERRAATKNSYDGGAKRVHNLLEVLHGPAYLRPRSNNT